MKWVWRTLVVLLILVAIFFGFYTVVNFDPADIKKIELAKSITNKNKDIDNEITILSWNIGYAGLGKNMDYFMSGGERNNPSEDESKNNLQGIKNYLKNKKADFYLLQEVDTRAKRSYFINQYKEIKNIFSNYNSSYALNYSNIFVPYPFKDPIGKVNAGLALFSKYKPALSTRIKLPGQYKWPLRLFHLDRCMLEMRLPFNNKEVVMINTHNSAFDDGSLKSQQMDFIKNKALDEYKKGNYVIIGGDWNLVFANKLNYFNSEQKVPDKTKKINKDIMPSNWQWVFDPDIPTSRSIDIPYQTGVNYTTIIDGFLVSPNVDVLKINTDNLDFEYSDHNPVFLKVRLK